MLFYVIIANWSFKEHYVMLSVEEASSSALLTWPLAYQRQPVAFLDVHDRKLILPSRPRLFGVSLGMYYSAFSGGVQYEDQMYFSRTGRLSLALDDPLSFPVTTLDGTEVDAVQNKCRVIRGDLKVTKTRKDGTVVFQYGGKEHELAVREVFTELLALTPSGIIEIKEDEWEERVDECIENGYPITRLSVVNWGLWPKSGVEVGPS
jgi:hypothetical protein